MINSWERDQVCDKLAGITVKKYCFLLSNAINSSGDSKPHDAFQNHLVMKKRYTAAKIKHFNELPLKLQSII